MANNEFVPQLPTSSARRAIAAALSDTIDLPTFSSRGIYVGVAGDVKVDMMDGGTGITFKAPKGLLDVAARRIYVTGTTATDLVVLF